MASHVSIYLGANSESVVHVEQVPEHKLELDCEICEGSAWRVGLHRLCIVDFTYRVNGVVLRLPILKNRFFAYTAQQKQPLVDRVGAFCQNLRDREDCDLQFVSGGVELSGNTWIVMHGRKKSPAGQEPIIMFALLDEEVEQFADEMAKVLTILCEPTPTE